MRSLPKFRIPGICSAVFALALAGHVLGQSIAVGLDATKVRALPPNFFGVNGQNRNTVNWDDPGFQQSLATVQPALLRFPGGTTGNYWDWKAGTFLTTYNDGFGNSSSPYPSPLGELTTELAITHAQPIYVLNLLTDPTAVPPPGGYLPFSPSSPNLSYQVQFLTTAQSIGLPVPYVELGNEFYLSGQPGYTTVYPDPATTNDPVAAVTYGRLATQWIASLRQKFPKAKFAVVGADSGGNPQTRAGVWNSALFDATYNLGQSGPAVQGADAMTIHLYPPSNLPANTAVTAANATTMLAQPFKTWSTVKSGALSYVPANVGVWVTEYNLRDQANPTYGTWAHGLYMAVFSLLFLDDTQVQMAIRHGTVSDAVFADIFSSTAAFANPGAWTGPANPPATIQWGWSATAMAMNLINVASAGQTQAQRLSFAGAPNVTAGGTTYGQLYGWQFTGGSTAQSIVLNLGPQPLTVDVGAIAAGGTYDQISGDPGTYVAGGLSGSPSNLTETAGAVSNAGAFSLPAFSITRFTAGFSRLANISVRTGAGTGAQTLIAGFVVGGSGTKPLLVRGVGPTLGILGVPNPLADPYLQLFDAKSAPITTNDNWGDNTNAAQIVSVTTSLGTFSLPSGSKDAALLLSLPAGPYTAQATAVNNGTGVVMVEVYDPTPTANSSVPRLLNLSARAQVGTGANILIAGFEIRGSGPKQVLIRGVGPTLSLLAVPSPLADPQLQVFDANNMIIAQNDNWGDNSDATAIAAFAQAVGTFGLPAGSKDSALLLTLNPGNYTAQVSGVGNTTGIGLVEVYDLQ